MEPQDLAKRVTDLENAISVLTRAVNAASRSRVAMRRILRRLETSIYALEEDASTPAPAAAIEDNEQ